MNARKNLFGYVQGAGLYVKRKYAVQERWVEGLLPADTASEAGSLEASINRRPLVVLGLVCGLVVAALSLRLFDLQIVSGERNLGLAEGNRIRAKIVRAPRGVIYDRNRQVLARNLASFDLTVIPGLLPAEEVARQALFDRLAHITGQPAAELRQKAEQKGQSPLLPVLIISNLERQVALELDQQLTELPGFTVDVNPIREYTAPSLAHFLGYTGRVDQAELTKLAAYNPTDYIGKLGLEKRYESVLRGSNGSEQTEVDALGHPTRVLANKPAQPGSNLVLSVDLGLQQKLSETIQSQMDRAGARRAAGVALNPKTGEVLAAVNLPSYDNNLFSRGISAGDYAKLTGDSGQPLFNKVTSGGYPTGSIIKPLVASSALQEKTITPGTTVVDEGALEIPHRYDPNIKYTFRSYDPGGLGPVNLYRAIMLSSNIYFYTIGGGHGSVRGLGVDRLVSYYQRFGLGQKTGIDLPEESPGRVPTPDWKKQATAESWYLGDTYNLAVGQGDLLVSPLQMAVATAVIANGGQVLEPHLVKQVLDDRGGVVEEIQPKVVRQDFITPANLALVREAMRAVVSQPGGTACCLIEQQVKVPVAAKTGTAESHSGDKRLPHAWFTAFAPYHDPQIVIVVLIENAGEGSQFAAPAAREALAYYFSR